MTFDSVSGYHKYTFDVEDGNVALMVVFSNGSGTQTADLELHNGGIYTADGFSGAYFDGITDIETDALCNPVYYNMQGMRVDNPLPGEVYIVVCGSKVVKEVLR